MSAPQEQQQASTSQPSAGISPKLLTMIPVVNGTLTNGARVGTWAFTQGQINQQDTLVAHGLGRVPNGYLTISSPGGLLYEASDGRTRWTSQNAYIRTTQSGQYRILWL